MEKRRNRFNQVVKVKRLVHSPEVPDWCGLPYPGHPKGCPNYYSGRLCCPPEAPYITEVLDLSRDIYLVHSIFDLEEHMKKMKKKHSNWTERQLRNVLYWQSRSKKEMKEKAFAFAKHIRANKICTMGEAAGVNLYATCAVSGLKLEKIKGLKICRHVALVGWKPVKTKRGRILL